MDEFISVVVTTYERPDALDAVLRALSRQTDSRHEVVIADDGSGPATEAVIDGWRRRLRAPLKHVWDVDEGFRPAHIRNRASLACEGDYLVFLDGDCVPRPDFVAAHRRVAERGYLVSGNRILLSASLTRDALASGAPIETWTLPRWLRERARSRINRFLPLLKVPGQVWRRWPFMANLRGANVAVWRDGFEAVDGFDASYRGWGFEDNDLVQRLGRIGVRIKDGRWATTVLHLWHPLIDRSAASANAERLRQTAATGRVRALSGLSALESR